MTNHYANDPRKSKYHSFLRVLFVKQMKETFKELKLKENEKKIWKLIEFEEPTYRFKSVDHST